MDLAWPFTGSLGINSIHPGLIDTPMIASVIGTPIEQMIVQNTPMGRLGKPKEIGEVITLLCGSS